jgi:hypothetical protein
MMRTMVAMVLAASSAGAAARAVGGRFVREIWAATRGNRFRVNSPDAKAGRFKDRWEAKQTGEMKIAIDEDLSQVAAAELYLELWGGHPGVANKRFTLNGKSTYSLPEVGAAAKNCTYSYPSVPLKLAELRRGENVFAFTCDRGTTFWGHYLIRAASVRLTLRKSHPALKRSGLAAFAPVTNVALARDGLSVKLTLDARGAAAGAIASVAYWGKYAGYDENGNGEGDDWHGFTKDRKPVGILGSAARPPFAVTWDTAMVAPAGRMGVQVRVHFRDPADVVYERPTVALALPRRKGRRVTIHTATDLPRPFWSRAGRAKRCRIDVPIDPERIEAAELHVVIWDGGKGKTREPFTLNGRALSVAGAGRHDVLYRVVKIDPKLLRRGANEIRVLSDTTHHGIEVLLPGPALVVRSRTE